MMQKMQLGQEINENLKILIVWLNWLFFTATHCMESAEGVTAVVEV